MANGFLDLEELFQVGISAKKKPGRSLPNRVSPPWVFELKRSVSVGVLSTNHTQLFGKKRQLYQFF